MLHRVLRFDSGHSVCTIIGSKLERLFETILVCRPLIFLAKSRPSSGAVRCFYRCTVLESHCVAPLEVETDLTGDGLDLLPENVAKQMAKRSIGRASVSRHAHVAMVELHAKGFDRLPRRFQISGR